MTDFYTGNFKGAFQPRATTQAAHAQAKACRIQCENTAKNMITPSASFTSAAISVAKANIYNQQCSKACGK